MKLVISVFNINSSMCVWFLVIALVFFIGRSQSYYEDSFEDNSIYVRIKGAVYPKFDTLGQKRYKIIKDRKKNGELKLYFKENDTVAHGKAMKAIGRALLATHLNLLDPAVSTWKFDHRVIWTTPDKAGHKKKLLVVLYKG